jgi:uncharacterized membrane protein
VDSSMRYFGFVVGFGFAIVWMTVGLGSAIVCMLLAALGYGAILVAERARASAGATPKRGDSLAALLDEFELENESHREQAEDATSPLSAEADYGWPLEQPEVVSR